MPQSEATARARASLLASADISQQTANACAIDIARAAEMIAATLSAGGKMLTFGNGGSAAEGQHLVAELVGRFGADRPALSAVDLTADTVTLTAVANDYGYEHVFSQQLESLGRPGDVAIAISTSGSSPNVLAGLRTAQQIGLKTLALTGGSGALADLADIAVRVPSVDTARVQEGHLMLTHALCTCLEALLGFDHAHGSPVCVTASDDKICTLDQLLVRRAAWRSSGKTVVWTNGCFDLLHLGHVRSVQAARQLGDVLVVGVNDNASVRALKGPDRPVVPLEQRAAMVAAIEGVTAVLVTTDLTPGNVLRQLQPDIHCKGAEYAPPDGAPLPERAAVEEYGGRLVFLPLVPAVSSSLLIERARGALMSG